MSGVTAVVMQPTYLPWLGYFDLIDQADRFVLLDSVQFNTRSWQQRNRIRSREGERWLTVPVLTRHRRRQLISEVEIDGTRDFARSHLKTLAMAYSKAPYFHDYYEGLSTVLNGSERLLANLNISLIRWLCSLLGVEREIVRSSELDVTGTKAELLVACCGVVGADRYLSPEGSRSYIEDDKLFRERGIELTYHRYNHPNYPQSSGPFVSHLSVLDLLFNVGPYSGAVIRQGREA